MINSQEIFRAKVIVLVKLKKGKITPEYMLVFLRVVEFLQIRPEFFRKLILSVLDT